jgi:glycosyltransferase involved in cell wall biosynthesis
MADDVERAIGQSGAGDHVRMIGYVQDADLPALYSGAWAYCQPSLYEGFGMPVLESMACGVPVIAANRSALPEVGGDAAIYVDPTDPEAIAAALRRLHQDEELRNLLIEQGPSRAASFTWRSCAEQTLAVLKDARDS